MVCLMYAAFKITDPTAAVGFDLAEDHATANQIRRDQKNPPEYMFKSNIQNSSVFRPRPSVLIFGASSF